jgi:hypothetical protein
MVQLRRPDDLFQAEDDIFVVGLLFAAFDAYGIRSNDVVRLLE